MRHSYFLLWIFTGFLVSVLVSGCNDRARTNPFDPHNGDITSNPLNLRLSSDTKAVYLDWNRSDSPDLTGYNVYRSHVGDSLRLAKALPDSVTSYVDQDIVLNTTYVYTLTVRGEEDETPFTAFDTITPGPTRWWVLSVGYNNLSQFSHDGLHLYTSYNAYASPELLVAPAYQEYLYTYDLFNGTLYRHIPGDTPTALKTDIYNVVDMLYSDKDRVLYFLKNNGNVAVFDIQSNTIRTKSFPEPITAGVVSQTAFLWVGVRDSLYGLDVTTFTDQMVTALPDGQRISSLASDENNTVYIGAGNANMIYTWIDGELDTLISDIPYPRQMEFNDHDHSLWVLSYSDAENPYEVYRYDGDVIQRMYRGGKKVYDIAVNPVSDVCLLAEYSAGTIIQIAPDGKRRYNHDFPGKGYRIVVQRVENM